MKKSIILILLQVLLLIPINCIQETTSFIIQQLSQFQPQQIIQSLNTQKNHFETKQLQIVNTTEMGLGLFAQQQIKPHQKILKWDSRFLISSNEINHGNFFINTLYLQHRKLNIQFKQKNKVQQQQFHFILNLFYHFIRINDSFLKGDLVGYPQKIDSLIFQINQQQLQALKKDTYLFEKISNKLEKLDKQYIKFKKQINLNQEQFNFFFQQDDIDFEDFKYLNYILLTRTHYLNKYIVLFPILNYANMIIDVDGYQRNKISQNQINQNIIFYETLVPYAFNEQIFIDYHIDDVTTYLTQYGFIPKRSKNQCVDFQILTEEQSNLYNFPSHVCIKESEIIVKSISSVLLLVQKNQNNDIFTSIKPYLDLQDYSKNYLMYFNAYDKIKKSSEQKDFEANWIPIQEQIQNKILLFQHQKNVLMNQQSLFSNIQSKIQQKLKFQPSQIFILLNQYYDFLILHLLRILDLIIKQ